MKKSEEQIIIQEISTKSSWEKPSLEIISITGTQGGDWDVDYELTLFGYPLLGS